MSTQFDIGVDDVGPYQIHGRREIIALLRRLIEQRQLVRMIFSEGGEAIATTVLAANEDGVIIDTVRDAAQVDRILKSRSVSFDTTLDRIRIAFFAAKLQTASWEGTPALSMTLPDSMIRLQRRENYRVLTPRCTIQMPAEGNDDARRLAFPVQNLSAGGVALIDDKLKINATRGHQYEECELQLPGTQSFHASLRVMNSQDITLYDGRVARRIGCEFVNLGGATLALVQRYVSKVQRDQNAKMNGMA
ncbi:flagellar brake protein [Noviherbaspirillum pedocola]|uniref:Flagellar brake protein YcgR n=1 Tax=Noviherbaspirillum pedocola TaxID=2801341 RepID=A0A934W8X6_9BURK|nr:flagellar brake protein [Noviherbaspirillum pedocola]MBK4736359.1 flagellar brake protein [Noviherbaspirillum pedocola]